MLNSVNTNSGALVALQSLNRTNSELAVTQKRISTGYKVNDGYDDGAGFAVAQSLRADVKAYDAVSEELAKAQGVLTVASEGATAISNKLGELKGVLVKLADAAVVGDERTQYNAQYNAIKADMTRFIADASLNGTNLINQATAVNVISRIDGTSPIALTATNLTTTVITGLGAAPATAAAAVTLLTPTTGAFDVAEIAVNGALNNLGANARSVSSQIEFISALSSGTEESIGAIVDADLAKESAKLQSLQIKQQLGTQALGIANQAPSILLSLFR